MSSIKALIIEDEPLIAEDIRDCLSNMDYQPVDVAYSKEQAFRFLEKYELRFFVNNKDLGKVFDVCVCDP